MIKKDIIQPHDQDQSPSRIKSATGPALLPSPQTKPCGQPSVPWTTPPLANPPWTTPPPPPPTKPHWTKHTRKNIPDKTTLKMKTLFIHFWPFK